MPIATVCVYSVNSTNYMQFTAEIVSKRNIPTMRSTQTIDVIVTIIVAALVLDSGYG